MDSRFAKAFATFDTSVYDETNHELLSFFENQFGKKKTVRSIEDTKNKLYDSTIMDLIYELNNDVEYYEDDEIDNSSVEELKLLFPEV